MSAKFDRLLAKSRRKDEKCSDSMLLIGHLKDVHEAAIRILDATGVDQLRAVGLDPHAYLPRLRRCVLLAAAVHDLGKANDHFQGMIHGTRDVRTAPQGLRHEWATILMVRKLRQWLLPAVAADETDLAIVEWAIAGHHPSTNHASPPTESTKGGGVVLETLLGHADASAILDWIGSLFPAVGSSPRPAVSDVAHQLAGTPCVFEEIVSQWRSAMRSWETRIKPSADRKFAAVVKNCLVAADIAGSALPKARPNDPDKWEWITDAFAHRPAPGDLEFVVSERLGNGTPRPFQSEVAASSRAVTFVKAGCGTGKTLAAYMWAARNYPTHRLYFCYPTTGTATEGFKDYLFGPDNEFSKLGAKLFHSRSDIDFEIILNNGRCDSDPDDEAVKLASLEAWSTPIVSCTVDTVLGVIQNNRRGLFGWPALSQGAFVFDEIHSYDESLFGAFLRFLADLPGLPVLLMTASLPKTREEALRKVLAGRGIDLSPIAGPPDLERLPRYHRVHAIDNDPMPLIAAELAEGGKVLWVCNIVQRVTDAAEASDEAGFKPLVYHSRFKYIDRVERHKDVVDTFTPEVADAGLAICSQVAEMSLDLKGCTLLITDRATVPALIQRLGRLNRQAKNGDATRPFCVIEPKNAAPYKAEELNAAETWLAKLPPKDVSQRDLAECWEQTSTELPIPCDSAWLDGGPVTTVKELRSLSPGITVLMREDVDRMQASRGKDTDVGRYAIPMNPPRDMKWQTWGRYKFIPIVEPSFIEYDRKRGAQWAKNNSSPSALIV
jgi:CRISPR-associated endonuclease/helicase Cas3